jgi:nucleotide-binding universal stress UspA family protein
MHFRKILFPIVFSEATADIASSVRDMAQRCDAAVTVLNACNFVPEYISGPAPDTPCDSKERANSFSPILQQARIQQARRLGEFACTHFSGVEHTERTEIGDPAAVIEWIAKCDKTDLIMMPTRGPGRFRRLLLGSVTSKILHDISCPVWTSAHNPEPVSALSLGYRLILCAIRMNLEDDVVLDVASIFVQICAARICLLYAQSATDERNPEYISQCFKQAFRRVCVVKRIQVTPDVSVRILRTDLSACIRHTALELGADLIIVGRGGEAGNFSPAFSPLYTIIRESPCPVLSV